MRIGRVAGAIGASACMFGVGSAALAAPAQKGGKIRVFVTNTSQTRARILITGAIGDYGVTVSQDANGKVDPNGDFEKVTLKHGGFIVNATALDTKLNRSKPTINTTNCSVSFTGSGETTIEDGTGAYTGLTGRIALTVTYAGITQKTAKGCNFANNAPSYGQYQSIAGGGVVSFK